MWTTRGGRARRLRNFSPCQPRRSLAACRASAALPLLLAAWAGPATAAGTTERVSVGPGGIEANDGSFEPVISAGGRYVAFTSHASNLVTGDTNGETDVFLRDRQAGTTELISLGPDGSRGNGSSVEPAITAGGRYVAFSSLATNWVGGAGEDFQNIFVHDRLRGRTQRVSIAPGGVRPNGASDAPRISPGGRYVIFDSFASNLVPGDTNGMWDVFLCDRQTGRIERVGLGNGGGQANSSTFGGAVSADGRFVAFYSDATNLVPGDTNAVRDVFVRDRLTRRTERISLGPQGRQGNEDSVAVDSMSADGSKVAFLSFATNLAPGITQEFLKAFVRDRSTGHTLPVAVAPDGRPGNEASGHAVLAPDGRFVAFVAEADNLVPGDRNAVGDAFVRDLTLGRTYLMSLAASGAQSPNGAIEVAPASGGRIVAFSSFSPNLVQGDRNGEEDIFVRTR